MPTLEILKTTSPEHWKILSWVIMRREFYEESDRPNLLRWEVFVDHDAPPRDRFRFILFSPQYGKQVGIGHEEMSGKTPWDVFCAGDAAKVTYQYQQCVDTVSPVDADGVIPFAYSEYLNIGGQWRWWRTTLLPIFAGDLVWKLIGSCEQITSVEAELRSALKDRQLAVYYQPISALSADCAAIPPKRLRGSCVVGWEALIRWPGSTRSPADFLPVAKASGAIQEITDFVIWEAVAVLEKLPEHHWVSVNISDCLFETQMEAACQHFAVDPSRLRIEVTEDWQPNPTAIARFRYARFIGHPIELDDFWVDRSNVGWIDLLEPVAIKLDRQFVTGAYRDPNKAEICRAAIALAKNYDPPMEVIVEGIESVEDMIFLSGLGADYGQGWLFSRAIPKEELWTLL